MKKKHLRAKTVLWCNRFRIYCYIAAPRGCTWDNSVVRMFIGHHYLKACIQSRPLFCQVCKYKKQMACEKYTAKTKCRKIKTNIPRKGILEPQFMCLWATYIFPRWVCLFCWRKYVDRSWEYINRSQTHECGNWGWGRVIPRKGIYKRYCRCSVQDITCFKKQTKSATSDFPGV